jgi:hypothetical protein
LREAIERKKELNQNLKTSESTSSSIDIIYDLSMITLGTFFTSIGDLKFNTIFRRTINFNDAAWEE